MRNAHAKQWLTPLGGAITAKRAGFPLFLASDPPWALETLIVTPKIGGGQERAAAQKLELADTRSGFENRSDCLT